MSQVNLDTLNFLCGAGYAAGFRPRGRLRRRAGSTSILSGQQGSRAAADERKPSAEARQPQRPDDSKPHETPTCSILLHREARRGRSGRRRCGGSPATESGGQNAKTSEDSAPAAARRGPMGRKEKKRKRPTPRHVAGGRSLALAAWGSRGGGEAEATPASPRRPVPGGRLDAPSRQTQP